MNTVYPSAAAALDGVVKDGQLMAVGGFGLCGIPEALIEALQDSDRFALEDALADARAQGAKGWRVPISRALTEIGLADLDD